MFSFHIVTSWSFSYIVLNRREIRLAGFRVQTNTEKIEAKKI